MREGRLIKIAMFLIALYFVLYILDKSIAITDSSVKLEEVIETSSSYVIYKVYDSEESKNGELKVPLEISKYLTVGDSVPVEKVTFNSAKNDDVQYRLKTKDELGNEIFDLNNAQLITDETLQVQVLDKYTKDDKFYLTFYDELTDRLFSEQVLFSDYVVINKGSKLTATKKVYEFKNGSKYMEFNLLRQSAN